MGIINVLKGLGSDKEIYNFNGILSENLDLRWKHCKIYLGSQELDPHYEVREEDVVLIREYPGMSVAALVVGIVSIVAAGITGGIAIYKAKQAAKDAQNAMDRLRNQMKANKEVDDIPSLSGARNQKAEGKQAPLILGKHLFTPYYICDPYMRPSDDKDGEDLTWYGTFIVGQSGLNIEELRNGSTSLAKFEGEKETTENSHEFTGMGDTEGSVSIIQGGDFQNDVFNQKWTDSLESTTDIGRKKAEGEQKTVNEYGEEYVKPHFEGLTFVNTNRGSYRYIDDEGPEEIIRQTSPFPMRAEIEIFVDGLSGWDSENGVATNATVEIEIGWSTKEDGPWTPIPIDPSSWADGTKLTRNSQKQMRFLATVDFPPSIYSRKGTPMYIRAVRNTMMHINGYKDRVYLSAIRTRQYNPKESSPTNLVPALNINPSMADKFCRMGIQLKVNKNTEENLDRFNVIASMTGRVWDKATKKWSTEKVKTSNPAAVALEVLTGLNHNASKFGDDEIDLPSFGRLYEYCENKQVEVEEEGTVTFNLECNGVLTTAAKKSDVLKEILAVCDAGLYVNEFGKKIVYYDDWQTTPIALLNPQRIVTMGETRNFDRRAEGYKVEFVNAEADWATDTHRILRPFVNGPEEEYKYSPIKFVHVTGYYHAMWLARRMMAKEVHRPGEVKVSVGKEGRFFAPGSLLKVQHEGFKHGIGSGEIIQNIVKDGMVVGLRTMEKFNLSKDRDYFVDWYVVDDVRNHVVTRQIQSTGQYTNELLFTTPQPKDGWGGITPDGTDAPAMLNIVSVIDNIRQGTVTLRESKRYLVADLSETEQGYDLILVQYHENVYETGEIKPYVSSIIKSNPIVFSPHVDTDPYDGANGINGKDGRGIESITRMYRATATNTAPLWGWNSIWWLEEASPTSTNKYLWFIERILYTDGSSTITKGLQAVYGDKGDDGDNLWQETYWGATSNTPNNTGTHDGRKVHHGNYLMYTGQDNGTWHYAFIYQWNEITKTWEELPREKHWEKYLDGVSDLTNGAPEGVFSTLFANSLFAKMLNGDYANIRMELSVGSANPREGKRIIINGNDRIIKSEDFVPGQSGFIFRGDGTFELGGGTFRGDGTFTGKVTATEGELDNVTINESCTVKGTLEANSINVSGGLIAGDNFTIVKDNSVETDNDTNGYRHLKTIRVAGKGYCRITVTWTGKLDIKTQDANGRWVSIFSNLLDLCFSSEVTRSYDVPLYNNINTFRLYGGAYTWGQGSSANFRNTTFEAKCGNNPGIFAFMSSSS
jgi:type II secretory pathway pseudopilin PulG